MQRQQDEEVITKRAFVDAVRRGDTGIIERFFAQPDVQQAAQEDERLFRARETEQPLRPPPAPWYVGNTSLIFVDDGAFAPAEVFAWFFHGRFAARVPHTLAAIVTAGLLTRLSEHGHVALLELVVTSTVFQDPFLDARQRATCLNMAASFARDPTTLDVLLAHGASMDTEAVGVLASGVARIPATEEMIAARVENGAHVVGHAGVIGYAIVLGAPANVIRTLISLGADARSSSPSPIHRAATHGGPMVVHTLITHGLVNFEAPQSSPQSSPLLVAVYGRSRTDGARVRPAVLELLTGGADPNVRGPQGVTALHIAAARGGARALLALLTHGADPNATCARGRTPLHVVAETADANVHSHHLKHLLRFRADPNVQDAQGATPLHLLAARPREPWMREAIATLVQAGADLFVPDLAEQTPLGLLLRDATGREWVNALVRHHSTPSASAGH